MQHSKYSFGGCRLELISDTPIEKERNFSIFQDDFTEADYTFRIIHTDALPEKNGECVYSSRRRTVFCGENEMHYTAYFNTSVGGYRDYACRLNDSELYVRRDEVLRELTVFDALNLPSLLLKKGTGILHCSYVDAYGEALLFAGDKQVGKSTQAKLWKDVRGCETVNGDRAALNVYEGRVYAHGIPFNGTSGICKNASLPLRAIVLPSIGTENVLKRLSPREATMQLYGKFTHDEWNESAYDALFSLLEDIAFNVPVYSYSCLKDCSAVELLAKELKLLF